MRQRLIWLVTAAAAVVPAFGGITYSLSADDSPFGLLGGTISNTGTSATPPTASEVLGDVGAVSTITGFPSGTASGFVCTEPGGTGGDPGCTSGEMDAVTAGYSAFESDYTTGVGLSTTGPAFSGLDQTFTGSTGNNVYASVGGITAADITLNFDAQNQSNVVFVIQINGSLTINDAITFNLLNGALASNIFWIIGGSGGTVIGASTATINPGANPITWDGDILAGSTGGTFTMSAQDGGSGVLAGTINGCVFTNAANTLAGITEINGCFATGTETPEPGTVPLVCVSLLALILYGWKSRKRVA